MRRKVGERRIGLRAETGLVKSLVESKQRRRIARMTKQQIPRVWRALVSWRRRKGKGREGLVMRCVRSRFGGARWRSDVGNVVVGSCTSKVEYLDERQGPLWRRVEMMKL